ncbi:hypothetical protein [Streptomyces sp. NBC_00102]|uniref:hypothetical protein n=1 Tax=Streptomyces sp. NBC_00102 TaxID=2975652 RepID=UPI00224E1995|nr:hypothetical protein [Streptomyces sp. NBC_00102]MCX5401037.1 hypothetical protein [Streptomyces sp. NBC_00102]
MSTTRHLVNRQRRLATVAADRTTAAHEASPTADEADVSAPGGGDGGDPPGDDPESSEAPEPAEAEQAAPPRRRIPRLRISLPALLCVLTVLLGVFAAWAFTSAATLRDDPSRRNAALTDIARTSEVKGQITEAVGAVFSYDYASTEKSDRAAKTYLTGKAVQQHQDMLAEVREQAPKQKLVLTTTVTESAVEQLDGDRARLLVFADQSNTRTGAKEETTYAAAMFAVDAVRKDGRWLIATIDTFTQ